MLKLICSDSSITLETTDHTLEDWISLRVLIAVGSGQSIYIEPGYASFLLPDHLPNLEHLPHSLDFFEGDNDMIEVGLQGVWLRSDPDSEDGVLVSPVSLEVAETLVDLWQEAQRYAAA